MFYLTHACVTMAVVTFVSAALLLLLGGERPRLQPLLSKALAAAAIPTAVALLWCSYYPRELQKIGGYQVHLCIAALVLGFCCFAELFSGFEPSSKESNPKGNTKED